MSDPFPAVSGSDEPQVAAQSRTVQALDGRYFQYRRLAHWCCFIVGVFGLEPILRNSFDRVAGADEAAF